MTADEIRAMMAGATPGRYMVEPQPSSDLLRIKAAGPEPFNIAIILDMAGFGHSKHAANATLFAASPDLAQMVLDLMAERDRDAAMRRADAMLYLAHDEALMQAQDQIKAVMAERDRLRDACLPLRNMSFWTESADDTEVVLVTVGTVRAIRAALAGSAE